ncbi:MAG: transposase [Tannerella sp.]|nr:transposase [Tannerella sp.]
MREFKSVIKMLRKHETLRLSITSDTDTTNAKTERLNGKIQRFVTQNYGLKENYSSIVYRTAGYFSLHPKKRFDRDSMYIFYVTSLN